MGDGLRPWQEAQAIIRGGHANEPKLDSMIQLRLRCHWYTPADRAAYAAALIRSHVTSNDKPVKPFAWHRLVGDMKIKVRVK